MQFDAEFVSAKYAEILAGYSPFVLDGTTYLAKHISSQEVFETNVYTLSLKEVYKKAGIMTEHDCLQDAISKGLWSSEKEVELTQIQKKIQDKRDIQPKLTLPSQGKAVEAQIKGLIKELELKLNDKSALLSQSVESRANIEKHDYIAFLGIYLSIVERAYESYDAFLEQDAFFTNRLIRAYYMADDLNHALIRCAARTTDARFRLKHYHPNPNTVSLHMLELMQWATFYCNIEELSDCPPQHIIESDEKLDAFLRARRLKHQESNSVKSEDATGMTGIVGAQKSDMEVLGGVSTEAVLKVAKS